MRQGGHFAFLFVFANSFQLHREVCNLCEVCNLAYSISYRKCIISSFDNPLTNYTLIYTAKTVFFITTTATSLLIPIDKIGLPVRRSRQFRRVNEAFVKTLIQELLKEPCGSHGCLFVVVKDISTREDFDIQKKDDYEYEVLGGTHLTLATKQLHSQYPDNKHFCGRMAKIYCGLTDKQAVYLGAMHQKSSSYCHDVTYREEVIMLTRYCY